MLALAIYLAAHYNRVTSNTHPEPTGEMFVLSVVECKYTAGGRGFSAEWLVGESCWAKPTGSQRRIIILSFILKGSSALGLLFWASCPSPVRYPRTATSSRPTFFAVPYPRTSFLSLLSTH